jgi:hypothetical protein
MRPESHKLAVRWWILPDHATPAEPQALGAVTGTRRDRGPLALIEAEPDRVTRSNSRGEHAFKLRAGELSPGRYRVVARAVDDTRMKGDRYPWVLLDEHGVLESERSWWLIVE